MWLLWVPIGLGVLGWFGYVWLKTLVTKYEHTRESVAILILLLAASVFLGFRMSFALAPEWSLFPRTGLTAALGFALFIVFSYVTVNIWCSVLAGSFDRKIEALEDEAAMIEQRLAVLRMAQLNEDSRTYVRGGDYRQSEEKDASQLDSLEDLRDFVDDWQQASGEARVRSIKVMEWKDEARLMSDQDLKDEAGALSLDIEDETDEIRKDQSIARLAVLKLEIMLRDLRRSSREDGRKGARERSKESPRSEMEHLHKRLRDINGEIERIEAQKREFLEGTIRLSWRERQ
ncbi:MAG TPA: hypothetical protein PLK53_05815 [Bacillota bacterium]|nr:hypothetical protein [Bacillota bacterium]